MYEFNIPGESENFFAFGRLWNKRWSRFNTEMLICQPKANKNDKVLFGKIIRF